MTFDNIFKKVDEIDGWFSHAQMEMLYDYVKEAKGYFLEIGTYRGRSTMFFRLVNKDIDIVTVDCMNYKWGKPDPNGVKLENKPIDQRVYALGNIIQIIGGSSYVSKFLNLKFGIIFIDGDHTYEGAVKDILAWKDSLVSGRLMIFHDYDRVGVYKAVHELLETGDYNLIDRECSMAILRASNR